MLGGVGEQPVEVTSLIKSTAAERGDKGLTPSSIRRRSIWVVLAIHPVPLRLNVMGL